MNPPVGSGYATTLSISPNNAKPIIDIFIYFLFDQCFHEIHISSIWVVAQLKERRMCHSNFRQVESSFCRRIANRFQKIVGCEEYTREFAHNFPLDFRFLVELEHAPSPSISNLLSTTTTTRTFGFVTQTLNWHFFPNVLANDLANGVFSVCIKLPFSTSISCVCSIYIKQEEIT